MLEFHCHRCGGFVGKPAGTMGREASIATPPVPLRSGPCVCGDPPVYRPAREPTLHHLRSATRN